MTFGFACVSHDPPLPSPQWAHRPERLHALLEVRANLVGLDKVPSVTLEEEARWLLLHPNCDVALVNEAGVQVELAEAVAAADAQPAPEPEPEAPAADVVAPEPDVEDEDDDELVPIEAGAPAPVELRQTRRPKSMPEPDREAEGEPLWRCTEAGCEAEFGETEAILSWARRKILCREHLQARRVV